MQQLLNRLGSTRADSYSVGFRAPAAKPIAGLLNHQLRRMWTMVERPYVDAFCMRIDVLPECCGGGGLSVTTAMSPASVRPLAGA